MFLGSNVHKDYQSEAEAEFKKKKEKAFPFSISLQVLSPLRDSSDRVAPCANSSMSHGSGACFMLNTLDCV